ncbi:MAG: hypothetical protein ACJAW3_000869 [Lentimonas sp.]
MLLSTLFLFSFESIAASIRSAHNVSELDFGILIPINDNGTITAESSCTTNGNISLLPTGCSNGTFSVTTISDIIIGGKKASKGTNHPNLSNRLFRVFLNGTNLSSISNGTNSIESKFQFNPVPEGCKSINKNKTILECSNANDYEIAKWKFFVSGQLRAINKTQEDGTYSTPYNIAACHCDIYNGCPTTSCQIQSIPGAYHQSGIFINGSFNAVIYKGISIQGIRDLYFGIVAPSHTKTGIIKIKKGGWIDTSDANGVTSISGFGTSGKFKIRGTKNIPYSLTLDTPNINLTGNGTPMPLSLAFDFKGNDAVEKQFDNNGLEVVFVIGELEVNPNQAPGEYTGTYNITANY